MAFTLSVDAQLVFFNKVFGPTHPVTAKVKALLGGGVTFEVSLYSLRAYTGGSKHNFETVHLSYGTTSLIKGTGGAEVIAQNCKLITSWVDDLYAKQGSPVTIPKLIPTKLVIKGVGVGSIKPEPNLILLIKAIRAVTGENLATAKLKAEQVVKSGVDVELGIYGSLEEANEKAQILKNVQAEVLLVAVKMTTAPPPHIVVKPVNAVISLKDAKALGQKVHGTSTGSVYHTIALSDHVRVAARIYKGGSISIRAEWDGQPDAVKIELDKLKESGVQMKSGYGSIHFDAADVPLQRVIGAFLVGTGINWKAAVMNGAELVITEQ